MVAAEGGGRQRTGGVQRTESSGRRSREASVLRTPWIVLVTSLLLTAGATALLREGAQDRDGARFANVMQATSDRITARLDIYVATLRGTAALFASDTAVDSREFSDFVRRLNVQRWYPGVQGIGWTERMERDSTAAVDEVHAIRFIEPPSARNLRAVGFNMYSESTRRQAMQLARDQGTPAATGRVRLVQETDSAGGQPGFLVYMPVYAGGGVPESAEERRANLMGFVYSPFRTLDLFAGIFGTEQQPRASIRVYDGEVVDEAELLYASRATAGHRPRQRDTTTVQILNRSWTVVFASEPSFELTSGRTLAPFVLLTGLLFSVWLFLLARGQAHARLAAEQANRAKSEFLAMMSHELRTPLNAISGYAELIHIGVAGETTPRQREYLDRIQRAQHHLLGLINNVLNFARLESAATSFQFTHVQVHAAVEEAVQMVVGQAETRDIRIVEDGGPAAEVRADAEKLRQVLLNILSNAVKFTDAGGLIRTGWTVQDDRVLIEITDTGIGIPPGELKRIFEPFVQVDADLTRLRQGTGLGLAISRELAQAMDGDIQVRSEEGVGSTFTLVMPRAPAP